MANVTSGIGSEIPTISSLYDVDIDTIVTVSANQFAWVSNAGHLITLFGVFAFPSGISSPPTGTVSQLLWDTDNNGSTDLEVSFTSPISDIDGLTNGNINQFWNTAFQEADTFNLNGFIDNLGFPGSPFAFDGGINNVGGAQSDNATISIAGYFIGDLDDGRDFGPGDVTAEDTIVVDKSAAGNVHIVGDVNSAGSASVGQVLTTSDDSISDVSVFGGDTFLIGDLFDVATNFTVTAGDDTITGGTQSVTIIGDAHEVRTNSAVAGSTLIGGDDSLVGSSAGDLIIGDVRIADDGGNTFASTVIGGNDTILGGDGDDTIYGEFETNVLGTITGGRDVILGEGGNDLIFGQADHDFLRGGDDNDTLHGGFGDDTIRGDDGIDTASYSTSISAITAILGGAANGGATGEGLDTLQLIENLVGSQFSDSLTGDLFDNVIEGGLGNDTLDGAGGVDTVDYSSAANAVTVDLGTMGPQATGGAGTDIIANFENLRGSAHNDILFGNGSTNKLFGGDGDDILLLENGTGLSYPQPGNDNEIFGEGGNDTLGYALDGVGQSNLGFRQRFDGGDDFDTFVFETFNSRYLADLDDGVFYQIDSLGFLTERATLVDIEAVSAGNGDDRLIGGGVDGTAFYGNAGDDEINAGRLGEGSSTLDGGADIDTISFAGSHASNSVTFDLSITTAQNTGDFGTLTASNFENITGSNGSDLLIGDADNNSIDGGSGDDTLQGGEGADVLNGGDDVDLASYAEGSVRVNLDLRTQGTAGDAVGDTYTSIENVLGTDFNDYIYGNVLNNVLVGGEGVDRLRGDGGDDTLMGGDDNDDLVGGAGADSLDGGTGTDLANYASSSARVNLDLRTQGTAGEAAGDTFKSIENVRGSAHNDYIFGDLSANLLEGRGGNDRLRGEDGNDTLNGGTGNDDLVGGVGADNLIGGTGTDLANYASASARVNLDMRAQGTAGEAAGDTFSSIENVRGSAFNDYIFGDAASNFLEGRAGNDRLRGDVGNDTLNGGTGNDNLIGGAGADSFIGGTGTDEASYVGASARVNLDLRAQGTAGEAAGDTFSSIENVIGSDFGDYIYGDSNANKLNGRAGDDRLRGDAGNDTLIGSTGDDNLIGGSGADVFVFNDGDGDDLVKDFQNNLDTIRLLDYGFADVAAALATASEVGGDVIFALGGGDVLTVENVTINQLANDLEIV